MSLENEYPEFDYAILGKKADKAPLRLLVEASAGTGKTYTLERMVVHFLVERRFHLSDMLIATFTRKASRELRVRIRALLAEMLDSADFAQQLLGEIGLSDASGWHDHVRRQVRDFAQAPIMTIHGFAQLVLEKYPAESGSLLTTTIDNSYPDELLRDYLRNTVHSGFLPLSDGTRIEGEYLDLYIDQTLVFLGLAKADGLVEKLSTLRRSGIFDPERFRVESDASPHPQAVWQIIRTLPCDILSQIVAGTVSEFAGATDILALFQGGVSPQKLPELVRISIAFTVIVSIFSALDTYRRRQARYFGLMSYDDLIRKLHEATALDGPLLPRLQENTKLILIDEFQDTDATQWGIFCRIAGATGHLVAVGDPKQAIYGFRGADLNTYLKARNKLNNRRRLSRNFRSSAVLVQASNVLFDGIFNQTHDAVLAPRIGHAPILPGIQNARSRSLVDLNGSPLEPIQFLTIDEDATKIDEIGSGLVEAISRTIEKLRRTARIAGETGIDSDRAISYSDFCILTRDNKQSATVMKAMVAAGIPSRVAGQAKLVESSEARDIQVLLDAIEKHEHPAYARKLLLTRFYRGQKTNFSSFESWELTQCMEDCARWHKNFVSLGLIGVLAELEKRIRRELFEIEGVRAPRTVTNYQHLADLFQTHLAMQHTPASRVGQAFHSFCQNYGSLDEESLRLDADGDFLTIMTMHSSKGLEFGIVFVFGGLRKTLAPDNKVLLPILDSLHGGEWFRSVDPWKTEAGQAGHSVREWEEWLRLFYVTATRARSALILPSFAHNSAVGVTAQYGFPSSFFPIKLMYERNLIRPAALRMVSSLSKTEPHSSELAVDSRPPSSAQGSVPLSVQFSLPTDIPKGWRTILSPWPERQSSFTSLSRNRDATIHEDDLLFHGKSLPQDIDEPISAPKGENMANNDLEQEPAGAAYGTVLHKALELLDFHQYTTATMSEQAEIIKTLFTEKLEPMAFSLNFGKGFVGFAAIKVHLERHLRLSLSALIIDGEHSREISSLDTNKSLREVSFHARLNQLASVELPSRYSSSTHPIQAGYLMGTIDLLVCVDGKWSVIDWKSNRAGLGTISEIEAVMRENDYYLQAFIYMSAVHQWLCARKKVDWNPESSDDESRAKYIFENEMGPSWYVFARYGKAVPCTVKWEELHNFQKKAGLYVTAF